MGETDFEQQSNMFIYEPVIDDPPYFTHGDNLLVAQNTQLMGDGGVVSIKAGSQVTHT
jgi:hypothetical protein